MLPTFFSKRCPHTTRLLLLPLFLLFLFGFLLNTNVSFITTTLDVCFPKNNIVFLKTHKCAGSSIQNILMRYGDSHQLTFVLPKSGNYMGHPTPFNRTMVAQPRLPFYNILAHHTRLDYSEIRSFMPSNSIYITIVRDPIEVFESGYSYYGLGNVWSGNLHRYLAKVPRLRKDVLHKRVRGKFGTNQMMFDLGANPAIFANDTLVEEYIDKLESWFHLVLVADRMDESLVLLRHLMCWELDDVVTFKLNARDPIFRSSLSEMEKDRLRKINHADGMLYSRFLRRFEMAIDAFGRDRMTEEVQQLRERTQRWYDLCVKGEQRPKKPAAKSKYYINSKVLLLKTNTDISNNTCKSMTIEELPYTDILRKKQQIKYFKRFAGTLSLVFKIKK